MTDITDVWIENRAGSPALGIGEDAPRLSWRVSDGAATGFEVERTDVDGSVRTVELAGSGTRLREWPFPILRSRESLTLRVRAVGEVGPGPWSHPFPVEAGLLDRDDWQVSFVSPSTGASREHLRPAYLLRAAFDLAAVGVAPAEVAAARLYVTAHGVMELELNGARIGDEVLAPGWTSYLHRLRYRTHDVTAALLAGENALGAWLADGWYRGRIGFDGGVWDAYGEDVALLAQLEVRTLDGTLVRVPLEHWRCIPSPITQAALYEGEHYDARQLPAGWSAASFDDSAWTPAQPLDLARFPAAIEAPLNPPVRVIESLRPVAVEHLPNGRIRLDFGQNIAGKLRITVAAPAGHVIRLHHAEVLERGALGTRPLRSATSIDEYTADGRPAEWTPRFTLHGFRYAELENWPEHAPIDVEALVVHSAMTRTGWFESSNPMLNRLHENVVWSMRDNFVDLPTDCPQRDERLGWTGDIQVFTPTALFLYGSHGVLATWLKDLAFEQQDQGHVPNFVPWLECGFPNFPTAAWGDAAVIVPWAMYLDDGDTRVLRDQYDSMRAWVDLVASLCGPDGRWSEGFQLGDWLDPAAPPDDPGRSDTDRSLVATAYHVRTARIVAQSARLLGYHQDAVRYEALAEHALTGFRHAYLGPGGEVLNDTATAIALCIEFDLLDLLHDGRQVRAAGRRLAALVAASGHRISTGFVGTPIICAALLRGGEVDAAYRLLLQDERPSWLYPITMGATTIWERWDSMLPDGSINAGDMTSFNHYALGAVADFLHRSVAGLAPGAPGWRSLLIAPVPGGGLTHASARRTTVLGDAEVRWRREGTMFVLDVTVPPGTTADVSLPGEGDTARVGAGSHHFECAFRAVEDDPGPAAGRRPA